MACRCRGDAPRSDLSISAKSARIVLRVTLQLKKEAFVALAAVAWADDRISRGEGVGLVRAAQAAGLAGDDLAAVEAATKNKTSLADFDASALTPWERALTQSLAAWLTRVDGIASPTEVDVLRALGDKLELSDFARKSAESAAADIAILPGGHRPDKYDLVALVETLKAKLPSATV